MVLKKSKQETLDVLYKQISNLSAQEDTTEIKQLLLSYEEELLRFFDDSIVAEYKSETVYMHNEFSDLANQKSILSAKNKALNYLQRLLIKVEGEDGNLTKVNQETFSDEQACQIVRKILINFYDHIEAMYEAPVHGKAAITKEILDEIKIGNEYDVQRILFSLLKPIFPEARLEVSNDNGYGTSRYDITIDSHSIVIEVKCSRDSMTERKLSDEISIDIYHYQSSNIFFFIYDKNKIVKNKTAFIKAYSKVMENKNIETVVIQPISL